MRINRGPAYLAVLLLAATASCSSPPAGTGNVAEPGGPAVSNQPVETNMPDLSDQQQNRTTQALSCPDTPGSMCLGPLIVRAEGVNLLADGGANSDGSRNLNSRGTIVFENRTGAPIRFAVLVTPTDALFNNGLRLGSLSTSGLDVTGVLTCRDGPQCWQGTPERFQTLAPGDSPARASIGFRGRMDGSLAASLQTVSSATITLQLYVVDANNAGSVLNVSLPNVPVQNQLRQ